MQKITYAYNTAVQSQNTVYSYFTSEQMLLFGFAQHYINDKAGLNIHRIINMNKVSIIPSLYLSDNGCCVCINLFVQSYIY